MTEFLPPPPPWLPPGCEPPEGDATVEYDVTGWSDSDLSRLFRLLRSSGIAWDYSGHDMAVPSGYESAVDGIFDLLCSDGTIDRLATASMVLGFMSPFLPVFLLALGLRTGLVPNDFVWAPIEFELAAIVFGSAAIVSALISRRRIKQSGGLLTGEGRARVGLVLGSVAILMGPLLLAFMFLLLVMFSLPEQDADILASS